MVFCSDYSVYAPSHGVTLQRRLSLPGRIQQMISDFAMYCPCKDFPTTEYLPEAVFDNKD